MTDLKPCHYCNGKSISKKMSLPTSLSNLLKEKNITTKQLAEGTGFYHPWIECLIDGVHDDNYHETSLDTIAKIANYLNVSINRLIYGEDNYSAWKPIETISKNPKEWLLLRTAKGAIVKGCYAYTHDKDYIAYMLLNGEIATTTIDDFIEWGECND